MQSEADEPVIGVTGERALQLWPFLKDMIEKACSRSNGAFTEPSLQELVSNSKTLLWVYYDAKKTPQAVAFTQIGKQANGETLCVLQVCGGRNAPQWIHILDVIETYAKDLGAVRLTFLGRPGWMRYLRDYKITFLEYEKELI